MTEIQIHGTDELLERLQAIWMQVRGLVQQAGSAADSGREAVNAIKKYVKDKVPPQAWNPAERDAFLVAAVRAIQARAERSMSDSGDTAPGKGDLGGVVGAIYAIASGEPPCGESVRSMLCELHTDLQLERPWRLEVIEALPQSIEPFLEQMGWSNARTPVAVRRRIAERVSRDIADSPFEESLLVLLEQWRSLPYPKATEDTDDDSPAAAESEGNEGEEKSESESSSQAREPQVLSPPSFIAAANMRESQEKVLCDLLLLDDDFGLSEGIKTDIESVGPDTSADRIAYIFYRTTLELWSAYSKVGNPKMIAMMKDLAIYLLSFSVLDPDDAKKISNNFYHWVKAQLPEALGTSDIKTLMKDVEILRLSMGALIKQDHLVIESLVEAAAAQCIWWTANEEPTEIKGFFDMHGPGLVKLHQDYVRAAARREAPENPDELMAWDALERFGVHPIGLESHRTGAGSSTWIEGLRDNVKLGNGDLVYEYLSLHRSEIIEGLKTRLGTPIGPEYLIAPTSKIYEVKPTQAKRLNPLFEMGTDFLAKQIWSAAVRQFKLLPKQKLKSFEYTIAQQYLAYALVKNSDILEARELLKRLAADRGTFPDVYWNAACCADHPREALERLEQGINLAPTQGMMKAALAIGLQLDDEEKFAEWLPACTLLEGIVLWYLLEFGTLDSDAKHTHLMRINTYLTSGEPQLLPNRKMMKAQDTIGFVDKLLRKWNQPAAAKFWLDCTGVVARNEFDFLYTKVHFLSSIGSVKEAAETFCQELEARIQSLKRLPHDRWGGPIRTIRDRSRVWLQSCVADELKPVEERIGLKPAGERIYHKLDGFAKANPGLDIMRPDRTLTKYFSDEASKRIESEPGEPSTASIGGTPPMAVGFAKLGLIGAHLIKRMHILSDVQSMGDQLHELLGILRANKMMSGASSLGALQERWTACASAESTLVKQTELEAARIACGNFTEAIRKEMPREYAESADQIIQAFKRVNDHALRDLGLLPEIRIEALSDEGIVADFTRPSTAFSVRVTSSSAEKPVSITAAAALAIEVGAEFQLRDDLGEFPVELTLDRPAVLTFGAPSRLPAVSSIPIVIKLALRYGDSTWEFSSEQALVHRAATNPPSRPENIYVYRRKLEENEIETHFFGREEEKQRLLGSISNGQQKTLYVEGIRRAGKSSLLKCVEHEILKRGLPLVPAYVTVSTRDQDHVGKILYSILKNITWSPHLHSTELAIPSEAECCHNASMALANFYQTTGRTLGEKRLAVLLDDFPDLVETGQRAAQRNNRELSDGISGLLNSIRDAATPNSRVVWIFAGQRMKAEFTSMLPGVRLWPHMKGMEIDFLDEKSVGEIITQPIASSGMIVPQETIVRVRELTGGHPEIVQQVAEHMVMAADREGRGILTPADAVAGVRYVSDQTDDSFADTWYPYLELSDNQQDIVHAIINSVPIGKSIELFKLLAGKEVDANAAVAVKDLVNRKIVRYEDELIGIRTYVLDRWLRRWLPQALTKGLRFAVHGSTAIFVDLANLTSGKGRLELKNLDTQVSDFHIPGTIKLDTALRAIEKYAKSLGPGQVVSRCAINYPKDAPAVGECIRNRYAVVDIPEEIWKKGVQGKGIDDALLMNQVHQVVRDHPTVNHLVLVTADCDFTVTARMMLQRGKYQVHIVGRSDGFGGNAKLGYADLMREFPKQMTLDRLEDVLENFVKSRDAAAAN